LPKSAKSRFGYHCPLGINTLSFQSTQCSLVWTHKASTM
jgi:hypothetical protein